jgi:predicted nucleic acid-binding protein
VRFTADSSAVVRLYDPQAPAADVEGLRRFLEEDEKVLTLSELARIEVLNVLLRRPEWGMAAKFDQDLAEGLRLRVEMVAWPAAFRQAESLARRFSARLRPGGHDLVLVAAAVTMGATWFVSYDRHTRQRPLAAAAGLEVWPPLSADERGLVRRR